MDGTIVDGDITTRLGRSVFCMLCLTNFPHDQNHPKDTKGWTFEMARQFVENWVNWTARNADAPRRRLRLYSIPTETGWRYWVEVKRG